MRPDAIFIQSESSEYFHAENPAAIKPAEIMNARRFLSLDLNYGRRVDSEMYEFLMDNGMTRDEYHFFLQQQPEAPLHHGQRLLRHQRAPGSADGTHARLGRDVRLRRDHAAVLRPLPAAGDAHRDEHHEGPNGDEAVNWLWKQWANVLRVRNDGVPIVGFTWYSLTDQIDWDTALREENGRVNPLGLYDLDRNIRPVGRRLQAADRRTGARCCRRRASASTVPRRPAAASMTRPPVRRHQERLRRMRHKESKEDDEPKVTAQGARR